MGKNLIGTLNEKPLHAALKAFLARPGDRTEVPVDGYTVDLVRQGLLIEVQTRNLSALKRKLAALVRDHRVRLVYPVAETKWIVRTGPDGRVLGRRRSPKRGTVEDVFIELVSFPVLLAHPHFFLEVLLIEEEEVRRHDAARNWRRRGWGTVERRLVRVTGRRLFRTPRDMARLIPVPLAEAFTTRDLARALDRPFWLAQRMAYCLRKMGALHAAGKQGNSVLYRK